MSSHLPDHNVDHAVAMRAILVLLPNFRTMFLWFSDVASGGALPPEHPLPCSPVVRSGMEARTKAPNRPKVSLSDSNIKGRY